MVGIPSTVTLTLTVSGIDSLPTRVNNTSIPYSEQSQFRINGSRLTMPTISKGDYILVTGASGFIAA